MDKKHKILCIGDIILEETLIGSASELDTNAPVPVVKLKESYRKLGGIGSLLDALVKADFDVTLMTMIGQDLNGQRISEEVDNYRDIDALIYVDSQARTNTLTRFIANGQTLMRADQENSIQLSGDAEISIIEKLDIILNQIDLVIVYDISMGMINDAIRAKIDEFYMNGYCKVIQLSKDSSDNVDILRKIEEISKK